MTDEMRDKLEKAIELIQFCFEQETGLGVGEDSKIKSVYSRISVYLSVAADYCNEMAEALRKEV